MSASDTVDESSRPFAPTERSRNEVGEAVGAATGSPCRLSSQGSGTTRRVAR